MMHLDVHFWKHNHGGRNNLLVLGNYIYLYHIKNYITIPFRIVDNQLHNMDNSHWNNIDGLLAGFDDAQLHCSGWSDQVLDLDETINVIPLSQRYPLDPLLDFGDLFDEFNTIFNDLSAEIEKSKLSNTISADDQKKELKEERRNENKILVKEKSSNKEEKVLTFEQVSKCFYMPITQAANELNMGLTFLKKKCRELGIPW